MTAALPDAQLAEVEEFLGAWDAAPAHRARYRDVISSQKSGDPDGGRKLRATTLRALLAEVRRLRGERQLLARDAADRADERDAAEAERARLATELGALDALRAADQVAMEDLQAAYGRLGDQAQRIVEAASQFRAECDRLHDALGDVLIGTWESNGAGDVRSPWIPGAEAEGWRRLLAGAPRSERDDETALTATVAPAGVTGPSVVAPDLESVQRGAAGRTEALEFDARPEATGAGERFNAERTLQLQRQAEAEYRGEPQ